MGKKLEIAFAIGATLAGTFKNAMGQAVSQVDKLGAAAKKAETGQGNIERFQALRKGVEATKTELVDARQKMAALKKELDSTDKPTKKLKNQMEAAGKKVHSLGEKLKSQRTSMSSLKKEMDNSGISTRNLAGEQSRLAKAFDKAKKSRDGLNRAILKQKSIEANREKQRGRLMDAAALGAAAGAPVMTASRIEDTEIRLSTVINAEDKEKAMADAKVSARQLAQTGLTSFADAYNIQYALNSAGLTAQASRLGATVVAKVATVTGGIPESVGEVIATTYNNLGNQLAGTTSDKMNRIGDILTKVQLKYQIRDFSQLGESMKEGAAGMANYNVNVGQGATLLGQLNSAGLQGSTAGTGLNAVLRNLGKASKEWNTELVRNGKGELDVIATMEQMKGAMEGIYGDDIDAKAQAIQKVFGDEGAKGFVPLLNKLEELKTGFKEVNEGSKGLTDREIKKFADSTSMHAKATFGSLTVMGDAFGSILLPAINSVLAPASSIAIKMTSWSEKFPLATKVVVGLAVGTATLTSATIAGAYAFSFLYGGIQRVKIVYGILKASTIGLTIAQKAGAAATGILTAAQWAWNVALNANPIGLVVAGVAAFAGLGVLVYKNWDTVKNVFKGIWDWVKKIFSYSPLGLLLKGAGKIGSMFGSKKIKASEGPENKYFNKIGKAAFPQIPVPGKPMVPSEKQTVRSLNADALKNMSSRPSNKEINLTVSPTIHIAAGANESSVRQAVTASLGESAKKMRESLAEIMSQDRRLSYE